MYRYRGVVDLSLVGPPPAGPLEISRQSNVARTVLPGIELEWRTDCADVALRDGALAIATTGLRRGVAARGDAQRWIERYCTHGERAADQAEGAFTAVVIDIHRRQALLFVDRFSIETLCYRVAGKRVGFSDTAIDVPGSQQAVNAQAIYDYLHLHVIPAPDTVFADVRRIEAAHRVTVSLSSVRSEPYWKPEFVEDNTRDLAERLRQFVDIVRRSVEREAADSSPACFLSGGTDSSTVAGMLSRIRKEPIHAYSIGFEAAGYDEMAFARIAARHFGLVHHEYYVTPNDVVDAIPKVAASYDQPFGNSSVVPAYQCALRAREDGFDRILAGDGGDELFAGNSRYAMQKVFALYERLPFALRHSFLEPVATQSRLFRHFPGFKQAGGYVRHARVSMPDRLHTFSLLQSLGAHTLFEPAFEASVNANQPTDRQRAVWNTCNAGSLINQMLAYDWKYTLADNDLPKVRGATQLAGMGVGYPLLDTALLDFSLAVPPQWKLKGLKLRWFFKEALRGFLPEAILRKKKHGFGLPFGHWVLHHPRLREFAEESLEGIALRGIVRPQFTVELMRGRLPEAPGYYGELVWILIMLEQWLRAHGATVSVPPARRTDRR